jgi:GYD domain
MPTFLMLTRLNPDAVRSPRALEELERDAMKRVRAECPDVEWLNSYAVLGPCDYLDIFIASDIETAGIGSHPNLWSRPDGNLDGHRMGPVQGHRSHAARPRVSARRAAGSDECDFERQDARRTDDERGGG